MKIFKVMFFVVTCLLFLLLSVTKLNYDNADAFGNIATFLSITTGFSITALSIIATSNFAAHLYTIENEKDNSKTLLHDLVGKFKSATMFFIFTIGVILLYSFLIKKSSPWAILHIRNYKFIFPDFIKGLVWYFTTLSLFNFIQLLNLFSKFVIKNASKK